ncbi:ATP-binding protein [Novosphingobium sp. PhB165]|uniref:ATP-binding protein n=1 Tax=Novosphingobium sp. PhB165 TaxID=2485105 RepID=UPI00104FDC54|nr:ATP-binding protein [Novosphingobium sp. PhB165]
MTDVLSANFAASVVGTTNASGCDFTDIELLHTISVELIGEHDLTRLYGKIVDAAVSITRSQFGTMQLLCPPDDPAGNGGKLQLLSHRGLPPEAVEFWQWVSPAAYSSCTMALKLGQRAIIPDFEEWRDIAGTEDLTAFRRAGIRSAQTTPLLSRSGRLLGMISTHWAEPHQPSERDIRLLDIVARQAADLLERTIAEESLRVREQELERTCKALRQAEEHQRDVEAALRHFNETLEKRVEERSLELMVSENQIRHMQKMEAIGQLTGGVAHDFNNLLTIIRSSADLLARPNITPEKQQKYVTAIAETADRAAKLTGQLLAFARRQALRPEVFDPAVRVTAIADMIRTVVGSRIDLRVDGDVGSCYVEVDVSQFETAVVNMAVNARDAMNGEGRLVIGIDAVEAIPPLRSHAGSEGKFVRISVADDGSGIPADQLDHIFEPFFTTKEIGKGTGLGLSQVYGFTKQSGGEIGIDSELGQGTTISLYLIRVEASQELQRSLVENPTSATEASILIVEDNDQVGEFASQLLVDLGYKTFYAASASEALAVLEREHEAIDVVFTDVVMPGIDGVELGRKVRARWPNVKVVLTSGYSHVLAEEPSQDFKLLHKPYSIDELAKLLVEVCGLAN